MAERGNISGEMAGACAVQMAPIPETTTYMNDMVTRAVYVDGPRHVTVRAGMIVDGCADVTQCQKEYVNQGCRV